MRVIACVRDPVARAYSAYWFARLNGWEAAPSFEDALELESARRSGTYQERSELTYLSHGYYAEQLDRWRRVLGDDRVHVVVSDELKHRPAETLREVTDWLGVPSGPPPEQDNVVNGAATARFPLLQRALMGESRLKAGVRRLTTPRLRVAHPAAGGGAARVVEPSLPGLSTHRARDPGEAGAALRAAHPGAGAHARPRSPRLARGPGRSRVSPLSFREGTALPHTTRMCPDLSVHPDRSGASGAFKLCRDGSRWLLISSLCSRITCKPWCGASGSSWPSPSHSSVP